jgi:hypothetical protein
MHRQLETPAGHVTAAKNIHQLCWNKGKKLPPINALPKHLSAANSITGIRTLVSRYFLKERVAQIAVISHLKQNSSSKA